MKVIDSFLLTLSCNIYRLKIYSKDNLYVAFFFFYVQKLILRIHEELFHHLFELFFDSYYQLIEAKFAYYVTKLELLHLMNS